ncbi:MAG: AAA family ATPase, partial [Clostridiales bacterium]|nr:AAA family ATPase [Clostridiales bacterium]
MAGNQYTQKSMEAIQLAQRLAAERGHQQLEQAHLLLALLSMPEGLTAQLLTKMNVSVEGLKEQTEKILERLPQVRGAAREEGKVYVSADMDKALRLAADEASRMKDEYISVEHLFLALVKAADRELTPLFRQYQITETAFLKALSTVRGAARVTSENPEETYDALAKYGTDLVDLARKGKLDPVIGRDSEIRDVIRILSRKTKNNPVLIGEPGVGKTAIAEGLALRIVRGDVPDSLKDRTVFSLDLGALIAGANFRGEFEERLMAVLAEIKKCVGRFLLFIDALHTIVG